jgi:hypothetical protein
MFLFAVQLDQWHQRLLTAAASASSITSSLIPANTTQSRPFIDQVYCANSSIIKSPALSRVIGNQINDNATTTMNDIVTAPAPTKTNGVGSMQLVDRSW